MDALDGAGQRHGLNDLAAASFSRRQAKGGPEAFAAGEKRIAHGLVDGGRSGVGGRKKTTQSLVHRSGALRQISLEIKGASRWTAPVLG